MKRIVGSPMAAAAALALFTVFPSARELRAQGLMITGYADFEAQVTNVGGNGNSAKSLEG